MNNTEEKYYNNQIAKYMTNTKLIELLDKLNISDTTQYAHIHANGEEINGFKTYSKIGIILQDYSDGTEKTKRVFANISPNELEYIHRNIQPYIKEFNFSQEKIFGEKDKTGYMIVTKLIVARAEKGKDGKVRNYPWFVQIKNGKGIGVKTNTGGTYCKKNSFKCESEVYINLKDLDFFNLLNTAVKYIRIFELTYGCTNVKKGRQLLEDIKEQNK